MYLDHRPYPLFRMDAKVHGVVLRHGTAPDGFDALSIREANVFEENGRYFLFYDAIRSPLLGDGARACLAVSNDLVHWEHRGPVLSPGAPGETDSAFAISPWVIREGETWHMFYIGGADLHCDLPYLTLKAHSPGGSLAGPWIKQRDVVPFTIVPGTFHSETASAGFIVKHRGEYLQFFSSSTEKPDGSGIYRTVGLARTRDLDGVWTVDPEPVLPVEEQIENTSLYHEPANGTWFLFTNHVGLFDALEQEFTDAVWVYWTKDLEHWDPARKAVVLDGRNCPWSRKCIGMPTVIPYGDRLALLHDAPGGDSTSHFGRDIGLAWLELPLVPPDEVEGGATWG
jgi:predicted GH43/DUF377 family glycosyl hydrolase